MEKKEKEEDQWLGCIRKSKDAAGLTSFKHAENARVFDAFKKLERMGGIEGKGRGSEAGIY